MEFADLLTKAFERSDALQAYWAFYATIVLGTLAFLSSKLPSSRRISFGVIFSFAFAVVALANLEALSDVTRQRQAIQALLHKRVDDSSEPQKSEYRLLLETVRPASLARVRTAHFGGDLLTILAIWILVLRQEKVAHPEESIA